MQTKYKWCGIHLQDVVLSLYWTKTNHCCFPMNQLAQKRWENRAQVWKYPLMSRKSTPFQYKHTGIMSQDKWFTVLHDVDCKSLGQFLMKQAEAAHCCIVCLQSQKLTTWTKGSRAISATSWAGFTRLWYVHWCLFKIPHRQEVFTSLN